MEKKHHVYGGMFVLGLIHLVISLIHIHDAFPNPSFALAVGYFGINFPDEDIIDGRMTYHRSTLTHSCLFPLLATISYMFSGLFAVTYLVMYFPLGVATHLLIDLITNNVPDEYSSTLASRWGWRVSYLMRGKVGGRFKGPMSGLANRHKILWLLLNAIICILCGLVLYFKVLYLIDLDIG